VSAWHYFGMRPPANLLGANRSADGTQAALPTPEALDG